MNKKYCTAVVLAAGQGKRMGTKVAKQYLEIDGRPLLYYTLKAFEDSDLVDQIVLVVGDDEQIAYCQEAIIDTYGLKKVGIITTGGKERYDSVYRALCAVSEKLPAQAAEGIVFIHDGARPFVTADMIERCYMAAAGYGACAAGMPVKDTIKIADENGFAQMTPPRDRVWMIQTPQTFQFALIQQAYQKMQDAREELQQKGIKITDDAMVMETFSDHKVKLVEGSYENIKITTPDDLVIAQAFLKKNE
ncbi:MAG: 2-C-methyl-D-erythritol 4-phosphate cytidylyltransferase [Lachnospiraceae bacterium]|nr:2-C-methyl-D-erythritol 4-phosphate cytidylyltransferase [Lachnospiraceae bacterium]